MKHQYDYGDIVKKYIDILLNEVKRFKTSNLYERFRSVNIFIYLLIYKVVIEFIYAFSISPLYSYSGLTLNVNNMGYWISTIYLLIIVLFSPKDKSRPSTYLFIILEVFLFTPTLSYYWLNNQSIIYTSFIVLSSIIISLILKIKPFSLKVKVKKAKKKNWFNFIFVFYVLIALYLVVIRGGIDARAFNFDLIYELRSENQLSGILAYLLNWCAKVFFPFYFVYFYYRKQYWLILPISVLQLLFYLSFGNKAFLFSIMLIVMNVYIAKRNRFDYEFIFAISGLNILAYILETLNITDALRRAIPYRMLFIPAQVQYHYYEFFSIREKVYFADGLIGKIFSIQSPYPEGYTYLIGRIYSGSGINANTGIFGDAYANGGFISMIVFAVIFAFILYFIDSVTDKLPLYIVIGSFSYMMFVLNDTSLLTALLTGGMGLMIFLLLLFNYNIKGSTKKGNEYINPIQE